MGIFDLFCSCDHDFDPVTFIYELNPYPAKMYRRTSNELYTSRFSKVIVLQTDRRIIIIIISIIMFA